MVCAHIIHRLIETKVLQNYSYMSILSMLSAVISILVYPYVIRVLGAEQYGLYAFLLAIVMYLQALLDYGFDQPAAKAIVFCKDNLQEQSLVVSTILYAKILLLFPVTLLAIGLIMWVPILHQHALLFVILFLQPLSTILLPVWYFQGVKDMRMVTIIQLSIRLLQIPLIFCFVRTKEDTLIYAVIVSLTIFVGGLVGLLFLLRCGIRFKVIPISMLRTFFKDATPFFLTSITGVIKERTLTTLIGTLCGMQEVALYDLANKIVMVPRLFTQSVNAALFPEVVDDARVERVHTILKYERWIGLFVVIIVVACGYPAILLLGGKEMVGAFPLSVVLSLTIYTYLIVGAYLQFVFIPHNRYYLVALNQLVALLSCFLFCGVGLMFTHNMMLFASALVLSGFTEVLFCYSLCRKNHLL